VAVIGGTGDLGFGLALRLAKTHSVTIGSRDRPRASAAAAKATALVGARVNGATNDEAASSCDIAILAVPDAPRADHFTALGKDLKDKLVISPIVPLIFNGGVFSVDLSGDSAAERVARALPGSRVASAFQTVPAPLLSKLEEELAYDVLVTADSTEVYDQAARLVSSVGALRPLYAGPLRISRLVEAITPVLLNASRLNKIDNPSIRLV
jgi:8-hydroxy-5-deazaflavin:NADPH oxidoreductase